MFKRFCLILSLALGMVLLAVLPAFAQSVDTAWVRRYNGPGNFGDDAQAIAVDGSGNVYVTGDSRGNGTLSDYATIRYYPNGDTAWLRRCNGPASSFDYAYAIAVDDSGNVYVTGETQGDPGHSYYATIKYYSNGDTAWVRRYNGPGDMFNAAYAIAVDGSGNAYVTGKSAGSGFWDDYATIKYKPNGDTAWVRRYNGLPGNVNDVAYAIAVDDSGNVYVTGESYDSVTYNDYATIKYYPNGDTAWVRRYNGPENGSDRANAIAVDDSGNVYVAGESGGSGTGTDCVTIKYYPTGDTAWVRRYNGPGNDNEEYQTITVDGLGNVYVTGSSTGSGTDYDYATIKYDSEGNELWVSRYNGPGNSDDVPSDLALDRSGNVYVTGKSYDSGTNYDYATIKYYPNGDTAWVKRYNGPGNGSDRANAMAVDGSNNVYVTGYSWGVGTGFDYATIKYFENGNYVRDETGSREKPTEFTLFQNYPNPFNQSTKIEFTLAKSGFVSLNIYDLLGRKVRTLVSEHLSSGYKSVLWDGKNDSGKDVASGIYFYQMKVENPASGGVGGFTETKKLVLLK